MSFMLEEWALRSWTIAWSNINKIIHVAFNENVSYSSFAQILMII